MTIHQLEDGVGLTGAMKPEDLQSAHQQGYQSLICNRQPGEDSPEHDEPALGDRARALGLSWTCIPVATGEYSDADVAAFHEALETLPRPLLIFCRSGRRSIHLWALARVRHDGEQPETVLERMRALGHDPETLRPLLGSAGDG
ncbi:beta-lactamase hydrolase domain-containing protein [Halovibrio salipaludis]|uniref:beta-lactamase hydrolase domain-containing protein n=1 Tax=Halovibrio salipaludis TaxID=2032626 RepID=UPI001E52A8B9|nr:sulfur transferase domain-containing protein [Halovibrio salipaludis]